MTKLKRILNLDEFRLNSSKSKFKITNETTPTPNSLENYSENIFKESINEILNSQFSFENDFIAKQYSFFQSNNLLKYSLISNFYKIFLININTTTCTLLDFYSLLILICPDFPKNLVKKIYEIHSMVEKIKSENMIDLSTPCQTSQVYNNLFDSNIDMFSFFVTFSIYFFYFDFFENLEKIFDLEKNTLLSKTLKLKEVIGTNQINGKSIFNYSSTAINETYICEILITMNHKLMNDYNLNTISTLEETKEILEKFSEEVSFNYYDLVMKILYNYNFVKDFFNGCDEGLKNTERVLNYLENL
jgi:hypothetical protein